jgi:hypothetical protein
MSEELKKEWRGQFEDEFPFLDELRAYGTKKNIIDFIISLLAKQQEEFVKMVENMPFSFDSSNTGCYINKDDLIADIKNKLNKSNE